MVVSSLAALQPTPHATTKMTKEKIINEFIPKRWGRWDNFTTQHHVNCAKYYIRTTLHQTKKMGNTQAQPVVGTVAATRFKDNFSRAHGEPPPFVEGSYKVLTLLASYTNCNLVHLSTNTYLYPC